MRIPPDRLGDNLDKTIKELAHANFEGKMENNELIILLKDIKMVGIGRVIHGDGAVYQDVEFDAVVFAPELHEVIEGTVVEVLKFGGFVRFGPLDGLLHISQIMDDKIDVDESGNRLIGRETKKDLRVGDALRARIVTLSLNERSPRESKIGLTMRQPCLGKLDWLKEERQPKEEKEKKKKKGKDAKREKSKGAKK